MHKTMIVAALGALVACTEPGQDGLDAVEQLATGGGPPGTTQEIEIERGSRWHYSDKGPLSCPYWHDNSGCITNTSCCFAEAEGPLGYGESYLATTVSYGPNAADRYRTTYFRKDFAANGSRTKALYLNVMYDDGFVFYINGREGGRAAMPSGTVTYSTLASGHEAENTYRTFDISSQIPNLTAGINTLSFEVHQASASSSDLVFDAELVAWVEPYETEDITTREGIARGARWRFWDQAAFPTGWNTPAFDDSGWSVGNGPLGFGETYLATTVGRAPVTTYFRKPFTIEAPVRTLTADIMYDDGFVLYLNGTEIKRAAMPSGTITQSTQSTGHEASGYQTFDLTAYRHLLVPGENVLAAEVHQYGTSSSDLVFDLGLNVTSQWVAGQAGVERLNDVWFSDLSTGWVVGGQGTLYKLTNGGQTWTVQPPPAGATGGLNAIQFVGQQHGWIVGTGATLLHTGDAGATWQAQTLGASGGLVHLYDVSFVSTTTGWVAGTTNDPVFARRLFRTTDGGATWTEQFVTPARHIGDIAFADAQHGWATGRTSDDEFVAIFATSDGGATWTQQWASTDYLSRAAGALEVLDASTVWAVGTDTAHDDSGETKLVTRDGGATWTPVTARSSSNVGLTELTFHDGARAWALSHGGGIIATTDGGFSWQTQQVPALREPADRVIGDEPELNALHMASPTHGCAVGNGGFYRCTTTGGN